MSFQIWPLTTELPPIDEMRGNSVLNEKKQEHFLKEFHNALMVRSFLESRYSIAPRIMSTPLKRVECVITVALQEMRDALKHFYFKVKKVK